MNNPLSTAIQKFTALLLSLPAVRALSTRMTNPRSTEALYVPHRKHAALFENKFQESWLHPDALEIVESARDESIDLKTVKALKEEMPQVYSFPCFSNDFLRIFNEEIANFYEASEKFQIPIHRPNSMNNYGVIVNQIGLRPMITAFQQEFLWPISRRLFPEQASQFDDHHSFIVRYQADEDLGLDMHTDDSDVTFNVCLGDEFTGASLSFCGTMGAADHRHHSLTYQHQVGRAILHLGMRRHGADDIETGTRANLIVWNHNWAWRGSPQYKRRLHALSYESEAGPPDPVCLSYTHDVDYTAYKELPERAKNIHSHPWCPPSGREYEGFDKVFDRVAGKPSKKGDANEL